MDATDPSDLTGSEEVADEGSGQTGSIEERVAKMDKRIRDKDAFINQLKAELAETRERQSRLAGSVETLTNLSDKDKAKPTAEPDFLVELSKQVEDPEFVDSVDATPSKGLKLIVEALARERRATQKLMQENWMALSGRDEALLSRVDKELPLRREIAAYSEAIADLRKDEDFADLSDAQLLKIAKANGAKPSETDDQTIDGPLMGTRRPSSTSTTATPEAKARAFEMGLQLHGGDRAKANEFVKRWMKGNGLK